MTDGAGLRLVLIEDHPRFRQTLRRALELLPEVALVAEAGDGRSGLDQAAVVTPHVVLCDVNLPGMSGLEVVGRLRDRAPTCPLIVLTVVDDAEQRAQAVQAGATAYVTKDSGLAALITLIRDLAAQVPRESIVGLADGHEGGQHPGQSHPHSATIDPSPPLGTPPAFLDVPLRCCHTPPPSGK